MITSLLLSIFNSFGIVVFFLGFQGLCFLPLTLVYELWKRRALRIIRPFDALVTVIVPAYNEEKTIRATVTSILASDYPSFEVIVVNDGSTDGTEAAIADLAASGRIRYINKENGGKASALNVGIEAARGSVVVFTDADSIFLPDTLSKTVRWFGDPSIDAVCGNDAPLSPSTPIQRFLAVTTHIGTGFVRRALSVLRCLPIITGNLGAVRTEALREMGGFMRIWGEDLEITFRLYKRRKRIIFDPEPRVLAECPGTIGGLWKQRIRWVRSYIKISLLHRDLFFNPRFRPFSWYLPLNFLNMAVVPILQTAILLLMPWAYYTGNLYFTDTVEVMTFLGVIFFAAIAVYSILLDGDLKDLAYLPYGLLIVPLSFFYNAVAIYSWIKELTGAKETWVKIERRGLTTGQKRGLSYALTAAAVLVATSMITYYYVGYRQMMTAREKAAFTLAVSTHFDAWGDWRKAVSSISDRSEAAAATVVGVSAGRQEWTYFRWAGHQADWSNHQKTAKEDMLERAVTTFHRSGYKVAAFIDMFGPKYIKEHPGTAAVAFDGKRHDEQVAFFEVAEGAYGERIIEMIEYISKHYDVDMVNLTEMPYYTYSYNEQDLASYERFTGRKGWPRTASGVVDRSDRSIWRWRTAIMERFIKRAANAAHAYGKLLYVDVPVSWDNFGDNGMESGLDYKMVLKHADNIVVWNYYYLEGLPPSVSESLARYMAANFPKESFYISIGLWGKKESLNAAGFRLGLASTLRGGVKRIWVTPDSLLTPEHWRAIREYVEGARP